MKVARVFTNCHFIPIKIGRAEIFYSPCRRCNFANEISVLHILIDFVLTIIQVKPGCSALKGKTTLIRKALSWMQRKTEK